MSKIFRAPKVAAVPAKSGMSSNLQDAVEAAATLGA